MHHLLYNVKQAIGIAYCERYAYITSHWLRMSRGLNRRNNMSKVVYTSIDRIADLPTATWLPGDDSSYSVTQRLPGCR